MPNEREQIELIVKESKQLIGVISVWAKENALNKDEGKPIYPKNNADRIRNDTENQLAMLHKGSASIDPSTQTTSNTETRDKWRLRVEMVTLLVFVIACLVYFFQWKAAEKQATAANSQLVEMRNQRMLDERAWVTPLQFNRVMGDTNKVEIIIKNIGKTPALNVQVVVLIADKSLKGTIPEHDNIPPGFRDAMFPNETKITGARRNKGGGLEGCYIYGTVWYDDIFKRHHWTQFCRLVENENLVVPGFHCACDDMEPDNSGQK